jgi:hypothetical protein
MRKTVRIKVTADDRSAATEEGVAFMFGVIPMRRMATYFSKCIVTGGMEMCLDIP